MPYFTTKLNLGFGKRAYGWCNALGCLSEVADYANSPRNSFVVVICWWAIRTDPIRGDQSSYIGCILKLRNETKTSDSCGFVASVSQLEGKKT